VFYLANLLISYLVVLQERQQTIGRIQKGSFNITISDTPNSDFMQADRHNYLSDIQHTVDKDVFHSTEADLMLHCVYVILLFT